MRKAIFWSVEESTAVSAALKAIMNDGISGRLEERLTQAQEMALPDKARHRKWHSSTASIFNTTIFKPLTESGRFNFVKRDKVKSPIEVKVPGVPRGPSVNIQAANGAPIILEQSVYEAVIEHYKRSHSPVPIVEKPKPTLDAMFSEMIDARLQEILPKMFSELNVKLNGRFDVVENRIGENFNNFMRYLDPNWTDKKEEIKEHPAQIIEQPTPKERKPVIVLINAKTSQRISVQKDFPDYDVRAIMNRVPGEMSPLMVVGFTKFMDHQLDNNCKKKFSDAYIRMPTGTAVSDAKLRIREHLSKINPR